MDLNAPFVLSRTLSTDDADGLTALSRGHHKKLTGRRHPKGDHPFFAFRMVWISARHG